MKKNELEKVLNDSREDEKSIFMPFKKGLTYIIPNGCQLFIYSTTWLVIFFLLHFYCDNKLARIIDIICYVNGILLAIIALMITGYSIFQALSGNKFVELCYKSKEKNSQNNVYSSYQLNFFTIIIIYIVTLIINTFSYFMIQLIDVGKFFDRGIKLLLIDLYMVWILYLLIELCYFVYNIYKIINIVSLDILMETRIDDDMLK